MVPILLVIHDSDAVRREHALEISRLLAVARMDGGMGGAPNSQRAVLSDTPHVDLLYRTDLLLPIVTPFLDAPIP